MKITNIVSNCAASCEHQHGNGGLEVVIAAARNLAWRNFQKRKSNLGFGFSYHMIYSDVCSRLTYHKWHLHHNYCIISSLIYHHHHHHHHHYHHRPDDCTACPGIYIGGVLAEYWSDDHQRRLLSITKIIKAILIINISRSSQQSTLHRIAEFTYVW